MEIRTATPADLAAVTALEAACFPRAEAAGEASFQARLPAFPDSFWLLVEGTGGWPWSTAWSPSSPTSPTPCTTTPPSTTPPAPGR